MENENIKKIIFFLNLDRKSFLLSQKIATFYRQHNVEYYFYSEKKRTFLNSDHQAQSLQNIILGADLVFNLLSPALSQSRILDKELKNLKIPTMGNSANTRLLFYTKNNLKKFLPKFNLKSPVFRFLGRDSAEEIFANFPQPSRIFSKNNNYFSGKIDSIEKMQAIFAELGENRANYLIEEFIEGESLYSFIYQKDGEIFVYNLINNNLPDREKINAEAINYSKKIFQDFGIENFALIHYKFNNIRSFFLLNIFVDFSILLGEKQEIIDQIFEQESFSKDQFFKILENNISEKQKNILLNFLI